MTDFINETAFLVHEVRWWSANIFGTRSIDPKTTLYGLLLILSTTWLIHTAINKLRRTQGEKASSSDLEEPASKNSSSFKAPYRPLGVWPPQDFRRPAAVPYPDWDIHKTDPLPYRPFKHGPYYITMGLRTMKWDEWIELDNQFLKFHTDKAQRLIERGAKCCKTAPEAFDGALELLEEL